MTFNVLPEALHPVWSWVADLLTASVPGCEHHEGPPQLHGSGAQHILEGDINLPPHWAMSQ